MWRHQTYNVGRRHSNAQSSDNVETEKGLWIVTAPPSTNMGLSVQKARCVAECVDSNNRVYKTPNAMHDNKIR